MKNQRESMVKGSLVIEWMANPRPTHTPTLKNQSYNLHKKELLFIIKEKN